MDHNPIIVALDNIKLTDAIKLAIQLTGRVSGFKVNDFFLRYGWDGISRIREATLHTTNIMLDLKLYDIPNTVKNHCTAIAEKAAVQIVTVHAHGGVDMMQAATSVLPNSIAAITVLTSFNQNTYTNLNKTTGTIAEAVVRLAGAGQFAKCSYLVCSGEELKALRAHGITLKTIVPGIRPKWHVKADDQKRTMTPREAIDAGADYLVIGRPIIEAADPSAAAEATLAEIGG